MTPRLEAGPIERWRDGAWQRLLPALTVAAGERIAVLGPSDSGKTHLGQLIAGIAGERQIRGEVRLDGTPVDALGRRALARRVGLVPSDPALLMSGMRRTLAGELELSLQLLGIDGGDGRGRIAAVTRRLGLAGLLGRDPFTLSGGEQVRAALALVLVKSPDLLVLDDCFAALDPEAAIEMAALVAAEAASGASVVELHAVPPPWSDAFDRCIALKDGDATRGAEGAAAADASGAAPPAPSSDPALEVRGLAFTYRGGFALGPVDLSVLRGEIVGLLGRNGAGKTTLLKCLALLQRATSGEIRVQARDGACTTPPAPRRQHEWARAVLYAFQNPDDQLYLPTVARELAETARLAGHADAAARAAAIAGRLGLDGVLDRSPMDLPRPARRLVALGACFAAAPPVLLLDEPTAGLDPAQRRRLEAALGAHAAAGGAALVVSHDLPFIARRATAALVLEGGRLVARIALSELGEDRQQALAAAVQDKLRRADSLAQNAGARA